MEGLIPLVYRAIKRSNARRKYRCLSQGPTQRLGVLDSHASPRLYLPAPAPAPPPENMAGFAEERYRHRRFNSMQEFPGEYSPEGGRQGGPRLTREVAGFRSHRMFSCISGGS